MTPLPGVPPLIVGILNCTPDSFHDGGAWGGVDGCVAQGLALAAQGADWIDVGGESTRPGATPVSAEEEASRVLPVIRGLAAQLPPAVRISIDTQKASVAAASLAAGATIVNDVAGLRDPEMAAVTADAWGTVVMHMRGTPQTMSQHIDYNDVVAEVRDALVWQAQRSRSEVTWIDPGIGFAKTAEQSLALVAGTAVLAATGYPVFVGASRKSFIGHTLGLPRSADRLPGSLAAHLLAWQGGARALRVHDVAETRQAVDLAAAVARAGSPA